jgi:hypothetical protein
MAARLLPAVEVRNAKSGDKPRKLRRQCAESPGAHPSAPSTSAFVARSLRRKNATARHFPAMGLAAASAASAIRRLVLANYSIPGEYSRMALYSCNFLFLPLQIEKGANSAGEIL